MGLFRYPPAKPESTILGSAGVQGESAPFNLQLWQEANLLQEHAARLRMRFDPNPKGLWALSIKLAHEVDRLRLKKEKRPVGLMKRGRKPDTRQGVAAIRLIAEFDALMRSGDFDTEKAAMEYLLSANAYKSRNPVTLKRQIEAAKKMRDVRKRLVR